MAIPCSNWQLTCCSTALNSQCGLERHPINVALLSVVKTGTGQGPLLFKGI